MPETFIIGKEPYWWERDRDRINQALMTLNAMLDERKKEKEMRMARDLAAMQGDPALAAGDFGRQFMEKYADDPNAVAIAKNLAVRAERATKLEDEKSRYLEDVITSQRDQQRENAYEAQRIAFEQNPGFTGPPKPPEIQFMEAMNDSLAATRGASPEWQALETVDPNFLPDVMEWLKSSGMGIPKPVPAALMSLPTEIQSALLGGAVNPTQALEAWRNSVLPSVSPTAKFQGQMQEEAFNRNVQEEMRQEEVRRQRSDVEFQREKELIGLRGENGGAPKDATDEVINKLGEKFGAEARAETPIPIPSETVLATVAEKLGPGQTNGALLATKAIAAWKTLLTDPKLQQGLKDRKMSIEEAWIRWAEIEAAK